MSGSDFMGFWESGDKSMKGYFFMWFDKMPLTIGHISGRIEDELGTATFEGQRTAGELSFTKRYVCATVDALKEAEYTARLTGPGMYRGKWKSKSQIGDEGVFFIEPYQESTTLDLIVAKLSQRNALLPTR